MNFGDTVVYNAPNHIFDSVEFVYSIYIGIHTHICTAINWSVAYAKFGGNISSLAHTCE